MNLQQLIESRESELDKMMPEACDCDINCTKKIAEPNDLKSFLSESIRLAYLAGLQRAKESVPEKITTEVFHTTHDGDFTEGTWNECRETTLSNIDNEIKSL